MNIDINIFVSNINFTEQLTYLNNPNIDESSLDLIFETCETHAKAGNPVSMNNLGYLYKYGKGIKQDYCKALEWFNRSAEKKNSHAENNLGIMYLNGYGVDKNIILAREWFDKSANKKNPYGYSSLGDLYFSNSDINKDYVKAVEYYNSAIKYGDVHAMNCLGHIYQTGGYGVTQNLDLAAQMFAKATKLNNQDAKENLDKLKENLLDNITISI